MMNVKLRPSPIRVNAILGYPCVMVRNGYFIPIFFLLTNGIVFRTLLCFRKSWSGQVVGGGGAPGVYVAHGLCVYVEISSFPIYWPIRTILHVMYIPVSKQQLEYGTPISNSTVKSCCFYPASKWPMALARSTLDNFTMFRPNKLTLLCE